ncbi:hypothetical protein [Streptococcus dysgalactiae]|uniref:Streptokinase C n=2 Tax=Streptococcus dysgalactiae group TaxID=119603 RepID=A0A9X8XFP3_STREQ|nr:hypothetical protein [Streptococcus dysgalactiae]SQF66986.1 streptokinase C [Streptococcus dysgalactiae subsp. equisimilis]VEF07298.1 streptokinase C [Streptococcus dysgalactiae subsp. equisimilis]
MKKHLGLLGVTLLSAAVFAHAKPVQAIVDYDPNQQQEENVIGARKDEPSGLFISISIGGKDFQNGQNFIFDFLDHQFYGGVLSKADLLEQIERKINSKSNIYGEYRVVRFDDNAVIKSDKVIVSSEELNTSDNFKLDGRKFSLTGDVIIEKVSHESREKAKQVDLFYTASFYTIDEYGQQKYLLSNYSYNDYAIPVKVGATFEDKDLLNFAYYILYTNKSRYGNLSDYVIVRREQTVVTENEGTQTSKAYEILDDLNKPFSIEIKERPIEFTYNNKKETVAKNQDRIHEVYEIVKKSELDNWKLKNYQYDAGKTKGVILNPNMSYLDFTDEERDNIISGLNSNVPFEGPIIEVVEEVIYWNNTPKQDETVGVLDPKTGLPYVNLDSEKEINPKTGLPYEDYQNIK